MRNERPLSDEQMRDDAAPDPALVDAWNALRSVRARDAANAVDSASTVDAAFDETRPEAEREAALLKALDGGQSDALALAHVMREAAREATHRDVTPVETPGVWARWKRPVLSSSAFIAAAAALVITVRSLPSTNVDDQTTRGSETAVALQAPLAGEVVGDSTQFIWQPVPDALSYTISWFDSTGTVVSSQSVKATQSTLSSAGLTDRARINAWQVEAITLDGRRIKSAIQPVRRR